MREMLVIALVTFHGPTGQRIDVNPAEVTSVREPREDSTLVDGVDCVLSMSNGATISLADSCETVRAKLQERSK